MSNSKQKELITLSGCRSFEYSGRFVSFANTQTPLNGKILLLYRLQSDGGFDEIATDASIGRFRNKEQSRGRNCINPTTGSDTTIVVRSLVGQQISVSKRRRPESQQMCGTGNNATAIGAFKMKILFPAGHQIPRTRLGVDSGII